MSCSLRGRRTLLRAAAFLWLLGALAPVSQAGPILTDLQLWFDAGAGVQNGSGVAAVNNDPVGMWLDQSPNAFNVAQANVSKRPVYITSGPGTINGLPAVKFDFTGGGAGADVLGNTINNPVASGSARTVFIVGDGADTGNGGTLFTLRGSTTPVATFQQMYLNGGPTFYLYSDGATVNATVGSGAGPAALTTIRNPFISAYKATTSTPGVPGALSVDLNGLALPVAGPQFKFDGGSAGFQIGNREDNGGGALNQGWNGTIAEVLVYNRVLTGDELNATGLYLTQKYGITSGYLPPPPPSLLLNENIGRAAGDFANDYAGAGKRVNFVGTPSNTGPTTLAQGPGVNPTFDFNTGFADTLDRTIGVSPNAGPRIPRDRKFDSLNAAPLILDTDNDSDFTDEVAQPGFGMHADALITFDLALIRSENGIAAGVPLRLTGEAGIANFRPGLAPYNNHGDSAAILLDGQVIKLFEFSDSDALYHQFEATSLLLPASGHYLTFVGLVGTDLNNAGAHIGFTNMALSPVPEPSTFALFGCAVLGLATMRRRKRA